MVEINGSVDEGVLSSSDSAVGGSFDKLVGNHCSKKMNLTAVIMLNVCINCMALF